MENFFIYVMYFFPFGNNFCNMREYYIPHCSIKFILLRINSSTNIAIIGIPETL